jgi:predicted O-methyltransferase YrrM
MLDVPFISLPCQLPAIEARTKEVNFTMASEHRTGALLQVLASSKCGGKLLELGTGTGISTAWLLSGMDTSSTLVSVDTDARFQNMARESLGHDARLTLVTEDAATWILRQPKFSFDLIFADAMPGKYEVLDETLALVKSGGFYVIDDMLPQPNWPEGHGEKADALLYTLSSRPRFSMVPMIWASGVAVLVRKSVEGESSKD